MARPIQSPVPTPRSSLGPIRTGPSRAGSGTTSPKRPRRRSPTPSGTSAVCDELVAGRGQRDLRESPLEVDVSTLADAQTIQTYSTSENRRISAADGVSYAYREV